MLSARPVLRAGAAARHHVPSYKLPLSVRMASSAADKMPSKVFPSAAEAVKDIKPGSLMLSSGFGLCGTPDTLIKAISENKDIKDLTVVSNNAGNGERGLGKLLGTKQIRKMISSFIGSNKSFESQYLAGDVSLQLTPQGTMVEKCRAGAFGIPAFYTATGYGTAVQKGELVVRYEKSEGGAKGEPKAQEYSQPKEVREFNGRKYILEEALYGDVAIVHVWKADEMGNCMFRYAASNFGAAFAKNAKMTIVEAEEIVPVGSLDANTIHIPSIFVNRIVKATEEKQIEVVTVAEDMQKKPSGGQTESNDPKVQARQRREQISRRAALELQDGDYVNLGVGMPNLVPNFLPEGVNVILHSENGILGMGPYPPRAELDADLVNAGKETVTLLPGASTFESSESFGMIRGGHVDVTMLGALQVGANGDLANWTVPGKKVSGFGGAMDLVSNPDSTKVVVLTDHVDKSGTSKIRQDVKIPLTGARCVSRIITDLCVFDVDRKQGGLTLVELMPGATLKEVEEKTDAKFTVGPNVKQ